MRQNVVARCRYIWFLEKQPLHCPEFCLCKHFAKHLPNTRLTRAMTSRYLSSRFFISMKIKSRWYHAKMHGFEILQKRKNRHVSFHINEKIAASINTSTFFFLVAFTALRKSQPKKRVFG